MQDCHQKQQQQSGHEDRTKLNYINYTDDGLW